ncbi:MAG: 50S ribosomal protein L4 [Lentisphaerae bacterium]|jgi:large subunit ribosomal protein L4|nr:50S ribosomal protein L4 [Lentisphaerota bacterium]
MSKVKVYTMAGEAAGEQVVAAELLERRRGAQAVQDVVTAHRANARAGTASTKTRGEVRGGGRKPFRQKGTGRARRGSNRSPLLIGGGVAFGPKPRDYSKKVNKKVAALAFRRALSEKIAAGAVVVAEGLGEIEPKTKALTPLLKQVAGGRAVLLVTGEQSVNLQLAARNRQRVEVTTAAQAHTYQIVRYPVIVADAAGFEALKARLSKGQEES